MKNIALASIIAISILSGEVIVDTAGFELELPFIIELPDDYDSTRTYPLIVCLHGYTDRVDSYTGMVQTLYPDGAIGLYPEAPFPVQLSKQEDIGFAWFYKSVSSASHMYLVQQSTAWIMQCIDLAIANYSIDTSAVILYGFSQGGIMTYTIGFGHPHRFRALIAGAAEFDSIADPMRSLDSAALNLAVHAFHGVNDRTVRSQQGLAAVVALTAHGIPAQMRQYPAGHQVSLEMTEDVRDFIYCQLYEGEVPRLMDILWPPGGLEPDNHAQYLDQILCCQSSVGSIESGLLGLYDEVKDIGLQEKIIYLLGAKRCAGAELTLSNILSDTTQPQVLRTAAYSALIKLGTKSAWNEVRGVKKQVVVEKVFPGTQAEALGLIPGDIIASYNKVKISEKRDMNSALSSVEPYQDQIKLIIKRGKARVTLSLAPGPIGASLVEEIK